MNPQGDDTSSLAESKDYLNSHRSQTNNTAIDHADFQEITDVLNTEEDDVETFYGIRKPKN